jgi:hypothetical protein
MTDDLMRMASFRIDKELWAKFGAIAKRERLTVTDVLTDYIQRCTDNDRTDYGVNTSNDNSVITNNYNNDDMLTMVRKAIDESLQGEVKAQVEPLADLITELEAYTRSQLDTIRNDLKQATSDRSVTTESIANTPTDKDPSVKSWAEFFKIIEMDALKAPDAQKKENIDTRTKQIEQGLQAAKEQGLGEWAVKVAGRSFVRVGN